MIVAPGTAASAAALTFAAVVPVSNVSPGPCDKVAGSAAGVPDAADDAAVVDEEPVVAAFAIPAPPIAAPTAAALTSNNVRPRLAGLDPAVGSPGVGWPAAVWLVGSDCMIAPSGRGMPRKFSEATPRCAPCYGANAQPGKRC